MDRLLDQATPDTPIEIVISPDDGFDYREIVRDDPRVVYASPGLNSGPAMARNRALARATGTHVCMLDADDSVSDLFLATVFRALERHIAFAVRSVYVKDHAVVRAYLDRVMTLDSFLDFYGSVLVVAPKEGFPPFLNVLAEDAVATVAVLLWHGGRLPVINAEYRINLHPGSYCATQWQTFTPRYLSHRRQVEQIADTLGDPTLAPALSRLYETRFHRSSQYDLYVTHGGRLDYHGFVEGLAELAAADAAREPLLRQLA